MRRGSEVSVVRRLSRALGHYQRDPSFLPHATHERANEAQNLTTEKLWRVADGLQNYDSYHRFFRHSGV
jgi:hypothetical protein